MFDIIPKKIPRIYELLNGHGWKPTLLQTQEQALCPTVFFVLKVKEAIFSRLPIALLKNLPPPHINQKVRQKQLLNIKSALLEQVSSGGRLWWIMLYLVFLEIFYYDFGVLPFLKCVI